MINKSKIVLKILHYQKYLGLVLILAGLPIMIFGETANSEMPLLFGLFLFFAAIERREDERSIQIKLTSLYIAFFISYGIMFFISNLKSDDLISIQLAETNHFIILALVLANAIYYGRLYLVTNGDK